MRKNFLVWFFLVAVSSVFSQTAFDKFENQEGVSTMMVNKKMFQLLSNMEVKDSSTKKYVDLIKKLDDLRIFKTQDDQKFQLMKNTANSYVKANLLRELISQNDSHVFLTENSKTMKKELVMIYGGKENEDSVLMTLLGNFELKELPVLIEKMKLPGRELLLKVSE